MVEQWPLSDEKIQAVTELINEQLTKGHIEPTNSPWNTPMIATRENQERRLLQDLQGINSTMEMMGSLQPGLPSPVTIPKNEYVIVIDLKECFFTIPLASQDCKRFAFSVPSPNLK